MKTPVLPKFLRDRVRKDWVRKLYPQARVNKKDRGG